MHSSTKCQEYGHLEASCNIRVKKNWSLKEIKDLGRKYKWENN